MIARADNPGSQGFPSARSVHSVFGVLFDMRALNNTAGGLWSADPAQTMLRTSGNAFVLYVTACWLVSLFTSRQDCHLRMDLPNELLFGESFFCGDLFRFLRYH
jgi:hypothetical protein